jgi:hypothetical protein
MQLASSYARSRNDRQKSQSVDSFLGLELCWLSFTTGGNVGATDIVLTDRY